MRDFVAIIANQKEELDGGRNLGAIAPAVSATASRSRPCPTTPASVRRSVVLHSPSHPPTRGSRAADSAAT